MYIFTIYLYNICLYYIFKKIQILELIRKILEDKQKLFGEYIYLYITMDKFRI